MALVTEKPVASFDLEQIGVGYLLWGRHSTWDEGKAGFVTAATEKELVVQYHPGIGNVTNHFILPVSEVVDGQWEIRWSMDMSEVHGCGLGADDGQHEEEGTEGDDKDDTGGADL